MIFIYLFSVCACACVTGHEEVREYALRMGSLLLHHGFQESNSDCQAWQQAPLSTEPSPILVSCFWCINSKVCIVCSWFCSSHRGVPRLRNQLLRLPGKWLCSYSSPGDLLYGEKRQQRREVQRLSPVWGVLNTL